MIGACGLNKPELTPGRSELTLEPKDSATPMLSGVSLPEGLWVGLLSCETMLGAVSISTVPRALTKVSVGRNVPGYRLLLVKFG